MKFDLRESSQSHKPTFGTESAMARLRIFDAATHWLARL